MAGILGERQFIANVASGSSYTIPYSNVKGFVFMSFDGTSTISGSLWFKDGVASKLNNHDYYSIGSIENSKLCLTKDDNNMFVVTNNRTENIKVRLKFIYI